MTIVISNSKFMFDVFSANGHYYMAATTGGVAQYDLTIEVSEREVRDFEKMKIEPSPWRRI